MVECRSLIQKTAVGVNQAVSGVDHKYDNFSFGQASPGCISHPAIERASRFMKARHVDQNELSVRISANSNNALAGSLRLWGDNGDLLANNLIQQRRFPNVRTAPDGHEACTIWARVAHYGCAGTYH